MAQAGTGPMGGRASASIEKAMSVTIIDRELRLQERLRDRLAIASGLRCTEHGEPVESVTIHGLENGWFDARWSTCCDELESRAVAIVKARC